MSKTAIQDILPLVQMPSRYLGVEVNRIQKPWENVRLHIALAFPDLYEIATSHFGLQILYGIFNDQEDILAERVFAPAVDMEAQLRQKKLPLCSLESATPLKNFDIIGFSLLYELNYTNVLNMLDLAGIRLFANQRRSDDPVIIAGGPCTCNPEPVADFFDAIVFGDGEAVALQMTDAWKAWRLSESPDREQLLRRWAKIKGVYIPAFFDVTSDIEERQLIIPKRKEYPCVERAVISDLNDAHFPLTPIIPFGKPIHDRLRMEIARGCTRGCRFCQAGMIYRPVRERHPVTVLSSAERSLRKTGYEDLSLLSLSTGDYSCIAPLMKEIMAFGEKDHVAVSLPSLRAGSLTPQLMALIKKVRKTGFTIAPEAGSQRLRDVINKNISDADIEETVVNAFSLGWKVIKLYFMIGLPTETRADIAAIAALVKRLQVIAKQKTPTARINVSIATFVPKPHTPFQWERQITLEEASKKLNWLKDNMKAKNVHVKWQDPRVSVIEGVWARGDRRLGRVLVEAWKSGCRFDGWSDFFNFERWMTVLEKCGIDPHAYTKGFTDTDQQLPWDHIRSGVDREFLLSERDRAREGKPTHDCRTGDCSGCGVCDFTSLKPIAYHSQGSLFPSENPGNKPAEPQAPKKYMLRFKKMDSARFLGHLEMINVFIRSFRRASIPVKYSQGFHPMPKISFTDTLPMGMQSEGETMSITLIKSMDSGELMMRLGRQLPDGLEITGCSPEHSDIALHRNRVQHYRVELKDGVFLQKELNWFLEQQEVLFRRETKRGKSVTVDLKQAIQEIKIIGDQHVGMVIARVDRLTVRPAQAMRVIFSLTDQQIRTAIITKLNSDDV
jgi:radical SAM family uncharacterized protein/radical SAM-linked protein